MCVCVPTLIFETCASHPSSTQSLIIMRTWCTHLRISMQYRMDSFLLPFTLSTMLLRYLKLCGGGCDGCHHKYSVEFISSQRQTFVWHFNKIISSLRSLRLHRSQRAIAIGISDTNTNTHTHFGCDCVFGRAMAVRHYSMHFWENVENYICTSNRMISSSLCGLSGIFGMHSGWHGFRGACIRM